jgi:hypothetical protein
VRILLAGTLCVAGALAQNTWKVYSTADRPHALALIGDRYHSPVYIRDNLAPALLRENIPVTFIENVEALKAESLGHVRLLIILRDGMNWPNGYQKDPVKWMTDAQRRPWGLRQSGGGFWPCTTRRGSIHPEAYITNCLAATTAAIRSLTISPFAWKTKNIPSRPAWKTSPSSMSSTW